MLKKKDNKTIDLPSSVIYPSHTAAVEKGTSNEASLKYDLALAYRILAKLGVDDLTYTHLSVRGKDPKTFYIYPFGMLFSEVKPSDLLLVTLEGEVLEGAEFQYNTTGYIIHGNVYSARKDVNAIFHLHTPEIVAVSACKRGLLPISQWALHFYDKISYHNYDSLALSQGQGSDLVDNLGSSNYSMLLRNHGSITSGGTVPEAMFYTYHLIQACKTQYIALSMGESLCIPNKGTCKKSVNDLLSFEKNLGQRDWAAWKRALAQEIDFS